MSTKIEVSADELIGLGSQAQFLSNPANSLGTHYRNSINDFRRRAEHCGFPGAAAAVNTLYTCTFNVDSATDRILPNDANRLQFGFSAVHSCLKAEAAKVTAILTTTEPPDAVNKLENLDPHQEALRQDLITCLRAHLARPAIVTAWALGYDLVRSWVFKDRQRLADFNTQWGGAPVVEYHDFFTIGEHQFLEVCKNSRAPSLQRFTEKTFDRLRDLLRDRNEFAHANFSHANEHEANAYVVRLFRIVTNPPFV